MATLIQDKVTEYRALISHHRNAYGGNPSDPSDWLNIQLAEMYEDFVKVCERRLADGETIWERRSYEIEDDELEMGVDEGAPEAEYTALALFEITDDGEFVLF